MPGEAWKENWAFVSADPGSRVGAVFHFSLRPGSALGVYSAKVTVDGIAHRYVGRSEVPPDPGGLRAVGDDRLRLAFEDDGYRVAFEGDDLSVSLRYTGRFATYDYDDSPLARGASPLGARGRRVFPFSHQEQALHLEGEVVVRRGGALVRRAVSGWASRDHSWGWRDDLSFRQHSWICASFEDRFVQATAMCDVHYDGVKVGGSVSGADGCVPVVTVDQSDVYWSSSDDVPLPPFDRDVDYVVRTVDGASLRIVAHIAEPIGRVDLNYRARDRSRAYEDRLTLCEFSLPDLGLRGNGVLETGKTLRGRDAVCALGQAA